MGDFMKILTLLTVFLMPILASGADFQGQREFTHVELEGRYRVTCFGGQQTKSQTHFCRGYLLHPFSWAHFNHVTNKPVTRVELTNQKQNGKTVRKKSQWDASNNRSEKKINLWVETLLQNPLLEMGDNQISYELWVDQTSVETGVVNVKVNDGGLRQCQDYSETTSDQNLCDSPSQACRRFFQLQNNCL